MRAARWTSHLHSMWAIIIIGTELALNFKDSKRTTFKGGNIQRSGWPTCGVSTKSEIAWLSLCFILERSWVALYSDVCQCVCQASVTPDQISTFSNIYRHTSPLLTMYHLISSSTNLYWPSTSQYRHILTQYHQVPLKIHHLMSHAQYTWSSYRIIFP